METWRHGAKAIFLNLFTVCSSSKRKLNVSPFVDEETNASYPFAKGINELHGLAHLCKLVIIRLLPIRNFSAARDGNGLSLGNVDKSLAESR